MEFRILGPLEVVESSGHAAELPGPKTRTLLVALLLAKGRVVSVERLVRALWGEDEPETAAKTLQTYVLQLRNVLEPARPRGTSGQLLVRDGPGYRLDVASDDVDAWRFESLARDGRHALADSEPELAADALANGLKLWRGAALEGFAGEPFARAEAVRLEDLRLCALEDRIEADLALGRHADIVVELSALVQLHPLREQLWGQLMLALYRSGRQGEALRAYQRARGTLRDTLGIEPGAALRRLEAAILAQDPALDVRAAAADHDIPVALDVSTTPFVGRDKQLQQLIDRWRRVTDEAGDVVFVTGDEGTGKTRLVAEAARAWNADGVTVLYGSARSPTAPLQPFADVLRGVGSSCEAVLASVDVTDGAHVAAAISAFLQRRAGTRGIILVLDDLHRADGASLEVLYALASKHTPARLLVVALVRRIEALTAGGFHAGDPIGDAEIIELGALGADDVATIGSWYLGERTSESITPLLLRAQGNALRVHREAAHLARTLASRRIGEASTHAATARRGLDAMQRDIAGGVLELQRLRDEAPRSRPGKDDTEGFASDVCPYKGLVAFEFADADSYYGREEGIAEVVARVASFSFLAVIGPSGSGKSSLVRAGLLPALRAGVLPGADRWVQLVMSPGAHPVRELLRRLGCRDGDVDTSTAVERACNVLEEETGLLVFVDQLEEVFTRCRDEDERAQFLDALVMMARWPAGTVTVVVAMRSDYYGHGVQHAELASMVSTNQVLIGPLSPDQLRRAIELPARRAGLKVDPRLVTAMVEDLAGQPGGLPLLSTSLVEAWEHRSGHILTLGAYRELGGVRGAVARLAESAFAGLNDDEQRAAQGVLRRLAAWEDGSWVRIRVALSELEALDPQAGSVVARMADRRLLTTHEGTVEVAHEALFREWPRLASWLDRDLELAQLRRHLRDAAIEWDRRGRDHSELYRGSRLLAVLDLPAERRDAFDELERVFVNESRAAAERESAEVRHRVAHQARLNRRLRRAVVALTLALALAVLAGGLAVGERRESETQALRAESRGLGAQSLIESELDRALLLALEANRRDNSERTRSSLLANLLRSPQVVGIMAGGGNRLLDLALSPDGRLLAGSDNQGKTYLWETKSRLRIGQPLERGFSVSSGLAFSPDGTVLATTGVGPSGRGQVVLWDVATRHRQPVPLEGIGPSAASVAFSGDGARLAASDGQGTIVVWDMASRAVLFSVDRPGSSNTYVSLDSSGGLLVSSDVASGDATFWDVARRAPVRSLPGMSQAHALSSDGTLLATAARDNTVYVHDVASGERRVALVGHTGPIFGLAFSPDGTLVASTSDDRTAIVWDVTTGAKREVLRGHAGRVLAARFSPDGATLYTNGLDDRVFVWDLSGRQRLGRTGPGPITKSRRNNRTPPVAISPDLKLLASSPDERTVTLRGVPDGSPGQPFGGHEGRLNRIAFSPDGSMLATTSDDGTAAVWDVATGGRVATLEGGHTAPVTTVAFRPDQRVVATGGSDAKVVLWDLATSRQVGAPLTAREGMPAGTLLLNLAFSPDGRHLVASGGGGDVALWSLPSRTLRLLEADSRESIAVAFAPDSRTLATGGQDAKIRVWDVRSGRLVAGPFKGHAGFVTAAAFGPRSDVLAAASTDGTVILWNVRTGAQIGSPFLAPSPGENRQVLRFGPRGRELAVAYDDGQVVTWDLDVRSWRAKACSLAGRNLTRDEWRKALGARPYRTTCKQWPSPS